MLLFLLCIFEVKHYLADWAFQTPWMVRGKRRVGLDFVVPLAAHAGLHALLTFLIIVLVAPTVWYLAALDFVAHFVIDRLKAGPSFFGRFENQSKKAYWLLLGGDQLLHHLTYFYIIFLALKALA